MVNIVALPLENAPALVLPAPEPKEPKALPAVKTTNDKVEDLPYVKELMKAEADKNKPIPAEGLEGVEGELPVVLQITDKTVGVWSSVVSLARSINKMVADIFNAVGKVARSIKETAFALECLQLISILAAPFHLFRLGEGLYNFVAGNSSFGEFLHDTFEMLLELTDSVVGFLQGLAEVGAIPLKIVQHLWPFDLVGIALSIISIVSNARGWHASSGFARDLEKLISVNGKGKSVEFNNLDEIVAYINSKKVKVLSGALDADGEDIKKRVNHLYDKVITAQSDEARDVAKKALTDGINTLQNRVTTKIRSHKLAIASASISIFANSVLFASPFIAAGAPVFAAALPIIMPVMHALKGVSTSISLSNTIYKMVENHKFSQSKFMNIALPKNVPEDGEKIDADDEAISVNEFNASDHEAAFA